MNYFKPAHGRVGTDSGIVFRRKVVALIVYSFQKKENKIPSNGVLSNISNPTVGLVFSEPLHAVREQQKHDFDQKHDLFHHSS